MVIVIKMEVLQWERFPFYMFFPQKTEEMRHHKNLNMNEFCVLSYNRQVFFNEQEKKKAYTMCAA